MIDWQGIPAGFGKLLQGFSRKGRVTAFKRFTALFLMAASLSLAIAACSGSSTSTTNPTTGGANPITNQKKRS